MNLTYKFSAPGRTEIGGNHTDHQHGCVMAAAVDLETKATVRLNNTNYICVYSEGYEPVKVALDCLCMRPEEKNSTAALVRGIAYIFDQKGAKLQGFDAEVSSTVLPGSGLSSSAAFEVLMGTIMNELFFDRRLSPIEIAKIGQHAENVYFGKPCGLMDQMASAVGGMVFIDFENPGDPVVIRLDTQLEEAGYALCIIDSGADHADLTEEYASIPSELRGVCHFFEREVLREISEEDFYMALPVLKKLCPDRALLRAMHIYNENKRVKKQFEALREKNMDEFLKLVNESGKSSWTMLQNVSASGAVEHQELALALALCEKALDGKGACRVHGGGFAGTIQAYVPLGMVHDFKKTMEAVLGEDSCKILRINPNGGTRID